MWQAREGSTGRLLQLCLAYFSFYVITGVTVKWFTGASASGFGGLQQIEFLVYSTVGGTGICLGWVILHRWYRLQSMGTLRWSGIEFPREFLYIIPSGVFTAVVIVTTTLNYMLLPSVMVAMVVTRGSVIVISRVVDTIQIGQGILHKRVYWQEDLAVVLAVFAVVTQVFGHFDAPGEGVRVVAALGERIWFGWITGGAASRWTLPAFVVLAGYVAAYALRIYIMNYFKNTRGKGVKQDNKGFFAIEQIAAAMTIALVALGIFIAAGTAGGGAIEALATYRGAIVDPRPLWGWAILAGTAYGAVAFFSVFIFMFKGRTATFAGLVNRLTSLLAGTTATLVLHYVFGLRFPRTEDWASFVIILVAVGFLTAAERRRAAELRAAHEIEG